MINLLPPDVKEQIAFSRLNRRLLKYLWLLIGVLIALGVAFGGTYLYLKNRSRQAELDLKQKETLIRGYKGLESQVKATNDRLATIKGIQAKQAKFSSLLTDLAQAMPGGTALTSISLTGDEAKPVQISATAGSYNSAVGLRDTLAASKRIAEADIQSVAPNPAGGFRVEILLAFKPGLAK